MIERPGDAIDVLVTEDVWGPPMEQLLARRVVSRRPRLWQDRVELFDAAKRARALVVRNLTQVDDELLAACDDLLIVARAGVGLDNIDVATADTRGVVVSAPLGANAVSVAEHTVGLALALSRRVVALDADCRGGGWNRTPGRELHGGTWGLLGAGATGRACARLATALGMRVIAYDPYIDPCHPQLQSAGIRLAPLTEVAQGSDVLSCHLPATDETRGLVDASLLAVMRPTALFVNVGRGEIVDESALGEALASRTVAGAALDVRVQEPPEPGPLDGLENVIFTPHVAGITLQSQERILRVLADDIDAVLDGRPASSAVGAARKARS